MKDDPTGLACQDLVEVVTDYLEGALSADIRARFDLHLELCDACRSYVEQIRTTHRLLILALERDGHSVLFPPYDATIQPGDTGTLVAPLEALETLDLSLRKETER